jgi:hypothetical protein
MHPLGKFNDREGVVKIKLIHIVLFGLAVNIFDILDFRVVAYVDPTRQIAPSGLPLLILAEPNVAEFSMRCSSPKRETYQV